MNKLSIALHHDRDKNTGADQLNVCREKACLQVFMLLKVKHGDGHYTLYASTGNVKCFECRPQAGSFPS